MEAAGEDNLNTSQRLNSISNHWVAIYFELEGNEIYYYDSFGSAPRGNVKNCLDSLFKQCELLKDRKPVNNTIQHQSGGVMCGMFALNFILKKINEQDVSQTNDDDMLRLRNDWFEFNA